MIVSRTPYRISFFGGGTDYPAWYENHGGRFLSLAMDKYCYISCRYLPPFFEHKHRVVYSRTEIASEIADIEHPIVREVLNYKNVTQGLEIHHDGDLPARSGVGSSSSFTVGLLNVMYALKGNLVEKEVLAKEAVYVERELVKDTVGIQDQIAATYGGLNYVEISQAGEFAVHPVVLSRDRREMFETHLLLCYTGIERFSTDIAKDTVSNFDAKERHLERLSEMVDEGKACLTAEKFDVDSFGELLHEGWMRKRELSTMVSSASIDAIYEKAQNMGVLGGKVLGAGGGGFMLFFAPPEIHESIKKAFDDYIFVPCKSDKSGSQIVLYNPDGF